MAIVWHKNLIAMSHRRETTPNGDSVELVYRVRVEVDGVEAVWNPFTYALNLVDQNLPVPGRKLWVYLPDTTSADWSDYFRCRSADWTFLADSISTWELRATFTSKDAWCPLPHIWRTDQTQTRTVDQYRAEAPTAAQLTGGNYREEITTATLANYLDDNGTPIRIDLGQQATTVSYIWNTSIQTTGHGYPNVANLISEGWLQSRNSSAFLGWPAGTVLLEGLSIDPDVDEYVRVTYQFLYDPWGHYVQVPKLTTDKRPATSIPTGDTVRRATTVYYESSKTTLKNFNDLITTLEEDWLTEGWRTYDSQVSGNLCTEVSTTTEASGIVRKVPSGATEAQVGSASEIREYPSEPVP